MLILLYSILLCFEMLPTFISNVQLLTKGKDFNVKCFNLKNELTFVLNWKMCLLVFVVLRMCMFVHVRQIMLNLMKPL